MPHKKLKSVKIRSLVSLSNFTTWKVGGPAQWFSEPRNIEEIVELICWAKKTQLPCQIIGAGSNLLISDNGLPGLTICMKKMQGSTVIQETGIVEALCGEPIPTLARKTARKGLHGLEWSVGIPGTVGGAIVMNAGAQGSCIADRFISAKVLSIYSGDLVNMKKNELDFSYRKSLLQKEKLIVLSGCFQLDPGHDTKQVIMETNNNLHHRLKTQPYNLPSCGSVFRNPETLKAGRIIEDLGLKGLNAGDAEISSLHANFIVNKGNATAKDISDLIAVIQTKVQEKHGFLLHPEVKRLGFD